MQTKSYGTVFCILAGLLLAAGRGWAADDEHLIRVVVTRGAVVVTGIDPPRTINRAGAIRPGEWVQPTAGAIAYVVRDTGVVALPAATKTRIAAAVPSRPLSPGQRTVFEHLVALALPKERWSAPAITKGEPESQTGHFRALYPRDSKVADREPVFAWNGGNDRFEVRLYRRDVDAWLWKVEVRGSRRARLPAERRLQDGQKYAWEVRDLRDPVNVDLATFETPTPVERQRLKHGLRQARAACRGAASTVTCELAEAGFYRNEGYVYEAIRVLEAMRSNDAHNTVLESLLRDLTGTVDSN